MDLLLSLLSNLWAVFLVIFFFGGSIFVHELGHFLAARRRGVVVERFSIGMGPPLFKWTGKDGVEYWLSWLPLGGYVKLPQLADLGAIEGGTSLDYTRLPSPSYTTKVMVFIAGAVFNLIFAFLLACVLWAIGLPTQDEANSTQIGFVMQTMTLPDGSKQPSPAAKAGIRPGDVVLSVDGRDVKDWMELKQALVLGSGRSADGRERLVQLEIKRGDEVLALAVNPILAGDEKMRMIGVAPAHPLILDRVEAGSAAEKLGLKRGDRIQQMDSQPVYSLSHLGSYLESHSAATVALQLQRNGAPVTLQIPPQQELTETLFPGAEFGLQVRLVHENPVQQLGSIFDSTLQSLASLINPRSDIGISKMTGPIGIVTRFWEAATSEYPMRVVMWITILINVSLAVFNLLPIPVLDGGHIVFATIAKLRGRALPSDFINASQSVFMVLLFSMIIYVSFSDVRRIIRTDRDAPPPPPPPSVPAPATSQP